MRHSLGAAARYVAGEETHQDTLHLQAGNGCWQAVSSGITEAPLACVSSPAQGPTCHFLGVGIPESILPLSSQV